MSSDSPLQRVRSAALRLKVFPLPSVVLFPGSAAPLHIFEPRYRAMVKDALDTDSVFALAQLQEGWETDYLGKPALMPMLCAGIITQPEQLPEGRYNLMLAGLTRARVIRELETTQAGYREVEAEVLEDPRFEGPEEAMVRQALVGLTQRVPEQVAARLSKVTAKVHGGHLADVVASAVVNDTSERYALLCELDVKRRLERVLESISNLVVQLSPKGDAPEYKN